MSFAESQTPEFDEHLVPGSAALADGQEDAVNSSAYQVLVDSYQALDSRQIQLERVEAAIGSSVILMIALIATVVSAFYFRFSWGWMLACGGGWIGVVTLIVFSFVWPPISIRHIRWKLDDVGLEIQRGVYWRHCISVPLARLQHADIAQGPLQRQWGLAKLIVYTAGTQHASVELEGLSYETATMLRDRLLQQQGAGDVV